MSFSKCMLNWFGALNCLHVYWYKNLSIKLFHNTCKRQSFQIIFTYISVICLNIMWSQYACQTLLAHRYYDTMNLILNIEGKPSTCMWDKSYLFIFCRYWMRWCFTSTCLSSNIVSPKRDSTLSINKLGWFPPSHLPSICTL